MRRLVTRLIPMLAALALAAGCSSTSTTSPPAPVPAATPPPPPIKEAPLPVRANLRAELAAGYYERGQMDIALQELAEAVKLDPTNPKIYNVYGLVYATLGQDTDSARNFRKALELAPNDSEFRQNWGWYLCTHGQARESIPEFEMAARNPLYKTPEIALINAGRCAGSLGENAQAEAFFKRALAASPNNPEAALSLVPAELQGRAIAGSARADEARHAADQSAPRSAGSGRVHRAQDG